MQSLHITINWKSRPGHQVMMLAQTAAGLDAECAKKSAVRSIGVYSVKPYTDYNGDFPYNVRGANLMQEVGDDLHPNNSPGTDTKIGACSQEVYH